MDYNTINERLNKLNAWIELAAKALMKFYCDEYGLFWRDTVSIPNKRTPPKTSTSTCRSFFALTEYHRFLLEESLHETDTFKEVTSILTGICQKTLKNPLSLQKASSNKINMFTDSHILLAASILPLIDSEEKLPLPLKEIEEKCLYIANKVLEKLNDKKGGFVHKDDKIHDFITLHSIRGIDSFNNALKIKETIGLRAREDVLKLLGHYYSGISSKFDPTELVFSTAVMSRFPSPELNHIFNAAINTIVKNQNSDGSWPTARIVSSSGKKLLHVASYEVALTLTNMLIRKIEEGDEETMEQILSALERTFRLVTGNFDKHYIKNVKYSGWANDHTRHEGLIESWTTAIVLTFLIHYRDALLAIKQRSILAKYRLIFNPPKRTDILWPDLEPALRLSTELKQGWDNRLPDPTNKGTLSNALKDHFITPILTNKIRRPGEKRSLILFGGPGSRKTSLVKIIGEALNWPVLVLSPPDFLKNNGLEGFEATAQLIFDDLLSLRRVVILFDECEDFIKKRTKDQQIETRTIGAFITAGMLPRLQALKDKGWNLFVFATNSSLKELDPAVIRKGRFDFKQLIDYPTLKAQFRYIEKKATLVKDTASVDKTMIKILKNVLSKFEKISKPKGEKNTSKLDKPVITFSVLDLLVDKYFKVKPKTGKNEEIFKNVFEYLKKISMVLPESLV